MQEERDVGEYDEGGDDDDAASAILPGVEDAHELGYYMTSALTLDAETTAAKARLRELNDEGVWTLSSARPGWGVEELLSADVSYKERLYGKSTSHSVDVASSDFMPLCNGAPSCYCLLLQTNKYWQSDGSLPHTVTVQFYRRQCVAEVALYLEFSTDESYTPQKLTLRTGSGLLDELTDLKHVHLPDDFQMDGWLRIPLHNPAKRGLQRYLRTSTLRLAITYNFQNGRDLHIRGLKVLGPDAMQRPGPDRLMPVWQSEPMFASEHVR